MEDLKIYCSTEVLKRLMFYVMQDITDKTGLYLNDKNNTPGEKQIVNATILKIMPNKLNLFLKILFEHPAIEERN